MKKFEVIEPNGFKHGGEVFEFGDVRSHIDGEYFINLGWAKDAETGESGERIEGVSKVQPASVVQELP